MEPVIAYAEKDNGRTCPWWLCWSFDNPLRRLVHDPEAMLRPHLARGGRALDVGPGRGFFTIPMARIVGPGSTVVALDIQDEMLAALRSRAERTGVRNIRAVRYSGAGFGLEGTFDFILLFWMFHEVADKAGFIREIRRVSRAGTRVLLAEPLVHVRARSFDRSVGLFRSMGFAELARPRVGFSRARLLVPEVPDPGDDHGDARGVGGGDA